LSVISFSSIPARPITSERLLPCVSATTPVKPGMARLSVRVSDRMLSRLAALALERSVTRAVLVRQLLEAGLGDRPEPPPETPSEDELLAILSERARAGNVAAVQTLLVREEQKDQRKAALALFEEMAARRQ
jgi:hypothetical protein